MRRSGKTTRAIDEAVQSLFKNKSVIFPYKHITENQSRGLSIIKEKLSSEIFTDSDWFKGFAQEDFIKRFIQRMKNEHSGTSVEIEEKRGYTLVSIKE